MKRKGIYKRRILCLGIIATLWTSAVSVNGKGPPVGEEVLSEEYGTEQQEKEVQEEDFGNVKDFLRDNIEGFHEQEEGEKEAYFLSLSKEEKYFFLRVYTLYFSILAEEEYARVTEPVQDNQRDGEAEDSSLFQKLDTCWYLGDLYHENQEGGNAEDENKERLDKTEQLLEEILRESTAMEELPAQITSSLDKYMGWGRYPQEEQQGELSPLEETVLLPMVNLLLQLPGETEREQIRTNLKQLLNPVLEEEKAKDPVQEEGIISEEPKLMPSKKTMAAASPRAAYKVGWNSDSTGWWYAYTSSAYYKNCWQYLPSNGVYDWYYFKADGYMAANTWVDSNNYVNGSGYCTTAGIGSFKSMQQAVASGHCSTARLTAASFANEAELRIGKTMTVTTGTNSAGCTVYGTGLKRWVITGNVTLEGNLIFDGQKDKVADDVTSNLFVMTGGTLTVQGANVCIQNSIGHGIYGEVQSTINVQAGHLKGNYNDGVGSYGTVRVSGGKFYDNDTGLYIAGTFEGKKTGAKGILTGGEFYGNQYGIASSDYAAFSVANVSIHNNSRYGFLLYPNGTAEFKEAPDIYLNQCGMYNFGETVFYSGKVRENRNSGILNEGRFTMKNGSVLSNKGNDGGGILNKKEFILEGGNLKGNSASRGGGIFNQGTFTFQGGDIMENKAALGGGICCGTSSSRTVIKGGNLTKNSGEKDGGGICIINGAACEMGGNTVKSNTAVRGGAIYLDGILKVSASPNVEGEVYLAKARYLTVTGAVNDFLCAMAPEDIFQGRVLAHYSFMPGENEVEKYGLEEKTQTCAAEKLLVLDGGKLELTAYAYSVYLDASACIVGYDANGGEGSMEPDMVSLEKRYKFRDNEFIRKQDVFVGWSMVKSEDKKDKLFYPGEETIPAQLLSLYPFTDSKEQKQILLYAVWDMAPTIKTCGNEFYEGEEVLASRLRECILNGDDPEDGDITPSVKITGIQYGVAESGYQGQNQEFQQDMPGDYTLDTYHAGDLRENERVKITLYCQTEDSAGNQTRGEAPIYVLYNEPPRITVPEQLYFTTGEVISGKVTEETLLKYVTVNDKEDDMAKAAGMTDRDGQIIDIRRALQLTEVKDDQGHIMHLEDGLSPGTYKGTLEVTDRFGKTSGSVMEFVIVDTEPEAVQKTVIRFISEEFLNTLSEESHWSKEDLKKKLENEEPQYSISLTNEEVQEIKSIAETYGQSKEESEKVIQEITRKIRRNR